MFSPIRHGFRRGIRQLLSASIGNTWHRPAVSRDLRLLPCKLDYNDAGTPRAPNYIAEPRAAGLSLNDNHLPLGCRNDRKPLGTMRLPFIVSSCRASPFYRPVPNSFPFFRLLLLLFFHAKNAIVAEEKKKKSRRPFDALRREPWNLLGDLIKGENKRVSRVAVGIF